MRSASGAALPTVYKAARATGRAHAGLLPDAVRAVRTLFAQRNARADRRVSAPLHHGRSVFTGVPCANDVETAIGAVGELRTLLTTPRSQLVV